MGNSTITLQRVYDSIISKPGVYDPRKQPAGFGDWQAIDLANQVMADLIVDRYNWKFNSQVAPPFYTNSWQQDYPQVALPGGPIGWGETCTAVDINNTMTPKPLWQVLWRRQLQPTSITRSYWQNTSICWMYNKDLIVGQWPGANVTYYPLISVAPPQNNPLMSMRDSNGNILIVTTFGTTGNTAPSAPSNSAEGATVNDGSVVWTVVSPTSQGYRLSQLPGATAPTLQINPVYQLDPPRFDDYTQNIDPLPDSFSQYFYRGLEAQCQKDPQQKILALQAWFASLKGSKLQGDREQNSVSLIPATSPVDESWWNPGRRSAIDPF
jgi:hypothetical protein